MSSKKQNSLLSAVIPAYNEEKVIGEAIGSLLTQTYSKFEIIIVDDGSTDKTREIVKKFMKKNPKKVYLIEGQHKGPGFSRNLGAKKARGEILIFVDADMTFDKDYLKKLTEPIIAGKFIGTEENQHYSVNVNSIWSRVWGDVITVRKDNRSSYEKPRFGSIFRAIKKDVFLQHGGFDPSLGYADDQTFFLKYGLRSFRVEEAICYHKNPETLREVYKQSRWIGASNNSSFLKIPIINYLVVLLIILASPVAVLVLSFRKAYRRRSLKLFIPWTIIFMAVRYYGTVEGMIKKIISGQNVR